MNVLNIHLIMADFAVCEFYLSEPFFSKAEKGEGITFQSKKLKWDEFYWILKFRHYEVNF